MASKKILYAAIDSEVYEDLQAISALAGLSVARAVEAIIAAAAGREHTFTQQVNRAKQTWKGAKTK
jgi:antitoxin component of RelBE/YafQ-DinJ toxin-antitoxin module